MIMRYRYRTPNEIYASILIAAGSGKRMTLNKLIFNCYLPHTAAIKFTATLVQNGLLEFDRLDRVFRTTDKGFKYLELHNEMSEIFEVREEPLPQKALTF
jgi:predicted transcriptional regulator